MNNHQQKAFISKLQAALGYPDRERPGRKSVPAPAKPTGRRSIAARIRERTTEQQMQLLDELIQRAGPLNLPVKTVTGAPAATAAICRLVHEKKPEWGDLKSVVAWQHPLIAKLNLTDALAADNVPIHLAETAAQTDDAERSKMRSRIVKSFIGITGADYCLAETATLVMASGPGRPRAVSLVPSIHVAVISLEQIIANLTELYALLRQDENGAPGALSNCLTFITGPSKTADIELNMVHGAHGPRELHLLVLIS